jgi:hypothetical protein
MFDEKSRYFPLTPYQVTELRGWTVSAVPVPGATAEYLLGYHVRVQGQRLDHLASHYLNNPAGFWRICELNNVMLPESLTRLARSISLPSRSGIDDQ